MNLEFGALNIDNSGLSNLGDRVLAGNAVSLRGGTITLTGVQGQNVTESLGTVTALGGQSIITATPGNTGTTALTIANLIRSTGSSVNFTGTNLGQRQSAGVLSVGSSGIVLTQIDTLAPALANGILGGWATVNGTDFASYVSPGATQGGVGAVGAAGFGSYTATLLSVAAIPAASNVTVAASVTALAQSINSLRVSAASTITQTGGTTITLGTGGLLLNGAASVITGGDITSGGAELFAYANATATISSRITGAGVTLVKNGGAALTLAGTVANTYGGGTVVNQNTLTLGGTAGIVQIPGNLTINNAAVAMGATNPGQIATAGNILINGGGTLAYTGANSVTGTITFNNQGGTVNPTISKADYTNASVVITNASPTVTMANTNGFAVGQQVSGTGIPAGATIIAVNPGVSITLSANATAGGTSLTGTGEILLGNNITSVNDSFSTFPTISSQIDLQGATRIITTSGLSLNNLVISGLIQSTGGVGAIDKQGAGSLSLTSGDQHLHGRCRSQCRFPHNRCERHPNDRLENRWPARPWDAFDSFRPKVDRSRHYDLQPDHARFQQPDRQRRFLE